MHPYRSLCLGLLAAACSVAILAQTGVKPPPSQPLARHVTASALSSGIEIHAGDLHESVIALRDDVLRIRIWRGNNPPEDASWAVLPEARHSSVPVAGENDKDHFGFHTSLLHVSLDRKSLQLIVRDQAGNIVQQDARAPQLENDASFRIYKTMPLDEHYFGLGDKTGPLDRRNQAFTLWNTDAYRFQESTDPIYKSIPYFLTYRAGRAAGVLLDNTWRTSFDFGRQLPGVYSFGAVSGPVDYYVFYGPEPKKVVETYAWLTGTPPLPPLWSFGFQQSRYSYMSQDRLLEVADRLRADHIPADAVYLDIDFQEKNRPFTVNRNSFPDLAGAVSKLHGDGFHVVAITDLHIANAPAQGYSPYDSGIAGDHFVKNADGTVYTGRVWPGPSVFPDFMRQQTRAWWGTLYRDLKHTGVDGFWNDMNEPSVFDSPTLTMPENLVHRIDEPGFVPRSATHAEIHDVYGMQNSRATFDGLISQDADTRPFVLTRATYAGGQRYAATWTGDNSSTWNHLRLATPMLENLGISGFAFAGADVGGYAGTPNPDLLTKWFEVAAFQPIYRDHSEKGTGDQEPWVGGPQHEAIRRRFIEARYQLMPYLYTLADEASRTGLPVLRPLFLEFPNAAPDHHPLDIDVAGSSEFLLGPDFLIAPSPYPDSLDAYTVALPSTGWYDYWTGEKIAPPPASKLDPSDPAALHAANPPLTVNVVPELSHLPVFVRAGSIIPIAPIVQSTAQAPQGPLTLRVYAGNGCSGSLYQDDGKTYAYRRGVYLRMKFTCEMTQDGLRLTIGAHEGSYPAWWTNLRIEVYGWKSAEDHIAILGKNSGIQLEKNVQGFVFNIADAGHGLTLDLK
jgi:alpha-glucosidase